MGNVKKFLSVAVIGVVFFTIVVVEGKYTCQKKEITISKEVKESLDKCKEAFKKSLTDKGEKWGKDTKFDCTFVKCKLKAFETLNKDETEVDVDKLKSFVEKAFDKDKDKLKDGWTKCVKDNSLKDKCVEFGACYIKTYKEICKESSDN